MAVTLMLFDTENIKQIIISSVLSRKIINIYNDCKQRGVYPKFLIFNY